MGRFLVVLASAAALVSASPIGPTLTPGVPPALTTYRASLMPLPAINTAALASARLSASPLQQAKRESQMYPPYDPGHMSPADLPVESYPQPNGLSYVPPGDGAHVLRPAFVVDDDGAELGADAISRPAPVASVAAGTVDMVKDLTYTMPEDGEMHLLPVPFRGRRGPLPQHSPFLVPHPNVQPPILPRGFAVADAEVEMVAARPSFPHGLIGMPGHTPIWPRDSTTTVDVVDEKDSAPKKAEDGKVASSLMSHSMPVLYPDARDFWGHRVEGPGRDIEQPEVLQRGVEDEHGLGKEGGHVVVVTNQGKL